MASDRPLLVIPQPTRVGRAKMIIAAVLKLHQVHPDDFYGTVREAYLVAARREAVVRLVEAGYSPTHIARILKRNHTTILNYLPRMREVKKSRASATRILRHLSEDARQIVIDAAKAEGVPPYVLLAQWVSERARYEAEAKARAAA